jgi:hypothetical protein
MMTRKLDAAIAEALDREVTWQRKVRTGGKRGKPAYTYYACSPDDKFAQLFYAGTEVEVPKFHKDGNAMLELIAEMHSRGWQFSAHYIAGDKVYIARFYPEGWPDDCDWPYSERSQSRKHADILPKAVALAAYKALTGKEWQDDYTESRRRKDNAGD